MRERTVVAFVAGETAHFRTAFEIVVVDRSSHGDHLASGLLLLLVIGIEMVFHVAELAIFAKRPRDVAHLIDELRFRQRFQRIRLDVLEVLFGSLFRLAQWLARGIRLLREHDGALLPARAGRWWWSRW